MKTIELSLTYENGGSYDKKAVQPGILYMTHMTEDSRRSMTAVFHGTTMEDFPVGWASESLRLNTLNGTHMCSPWHFAEAKSCGCKPLGIDDFQLENGVATGVKLDFTAVPAGTVITCAMVQEAAAKAGVEMKEGVMPFFCFGGNPVEAPKASLSEEVINCLAEKGINVIGIDASEITDGTNAKAAAQACANKAMYVIECVDRLAEVPGKFEVAAFPIKVKNATAAWCVPVAKF